jgi:hypothetical protein
MPVSGQASPAPAVPPSSGRLAQAALCTRDARNEDWLCPVDEARNDVARPVPIDYLRKPILNRNHVTGRRRCHVAVRERVFEHRTDLRELAGEVVGQAALFGFDARARVVGNEVAQSRVCVLYVAQVAGTVERVEAGLRQIGRVADVMQVRGGFE